MTLRRHQMTEHKNISDSETQTLHRAYSCRDRPLLAASLRRADMSREHLHQMDVTSSQDECWHFPRSERRLRRPLPARADLRMCDNTPIITSASPRLHPFPSARSAKAGGPEIAGTASACAAWRPVLYYTMDEHGGEWKSRVSCARRMASTDRRRQFCWCAAGPEQVLRSRPPARIRRAGRSS